MPRDEREARLHSPVGGVAPPDEHASPDDGPCIVDYDADGHAGFLRRCILELQATERRCDPRLPPGEAMADAYIRLLLERCREWDGLLAVAELAGEPVGFVSLFRRVPSTEPDEPPGEFALVSDLVVAPGYRRRGVAAALMRFAEARAREAGAPVLRLEVMAGNGAARSLYARLGFRPRVVHLEKPIHPRP